MDNMKFRIFLLTLLMIFFSSKITMNASLTNIQRMCKELTYNDVYYEILKLDIKFPNIVFAQALIETGHFTSDLLHKENNLFGMRYPRVRETTAIGESENGYASYDEWDESVQDYLLWQTNMIGDKNNITEDEYLNLLSRVYAEDKNYVRKIKSMVYN